MPIQRVILCTQQFGNYWSGLGAYSTSLAKGLLERGIEVVVIAPMGAEPIEGIGWIEVVPAKWDFTHGKWLSLSYAYAKALRSLDADLVHFTDARESYAYHGEMTAVGTLHDDYFARHRWWPWYYRRDYVDWLQRWAYYSFVTLLERRALRGLKALTANSIATAETISARYGIPQERITTIYLGLDLKMQPVNDALEAERLANPKIIFVGGNMQRKGLPSVLRAMQNLIPLYPKLRLQVLGKNQNLEKMQKLAAKLGVAEHVDFLGWVSPEKVGYYFRNAAIFVMPSLMEGFGLVFLEAMAAGVPVIGGNVGGTRELIQDGMNGVLVSPNSPGKLASGIQELLTDSEFRANLRTMGQKTIEEYTLDSMVQNTYLWYEEISGEV
ncbi:MAG: glycosyltransferase family 4 protein [Candidatus Marinimicrobia bacterium]|nr:glycosyltransferase family 4 protein [Candidatus Neomarinimicrobiota bacterium]MCF7902494.1 glycosyltransferase family 4 protein [Candidatus Neomarinimicrobiota bacterium]